MTNNHQQQQTILFLQLFLISLLVKTGSRVISPQDPLITDCFEHIENRDRILGIMQIPKPLLAGVPGLSAYRTTCMDWGLMFASYIILPALLCLRNPEFVSGPSLSVSVQPMMIACRQPGAVCLKPVPWCGNMCQAVWAFFWNSAWGKNSVCYIYEVGDHELVRNLWSRSSAISFLDSSSFSFFIQAADSAFFFRLR